MKQQLDEKKKEYRELLKGIESERQSLSQKERTVEELRSQLRERETERDTERDTEREQFRLEVRASVQLNEAPKIIVVP